MSTPVPQPSNPLTGLKDRIAEYWKEFLPQKWRELRANGTLSEALQSAKDQTAEAYHDAVLGGLAPDQAWELVKGDWAFPPPEPKDRPQQP